MGRCSASRRKVNGLVPLPLDQQSGERRARRNKNEHESRRRAQALVEEIGIVTPYAAQVHLTLALYGVGRKLGVGRVSPELRIW